jgi:DNA-binding NarL/FixJ family response regulator
MSASQRLDSVRASAQVAAVPVAVMRIPGDEWVFGSVGAAEVVVLDVHEAPLPAATVAAVTEQAGQKPIVVVCDRPSPAEIRSLLAAGASGVARRADVRSALNAVVAAVCAGQVCVPKAASDAVTRPLLSIREKQVVGLVAMGLTNREIADQLVVAESTVKSHLSSAFTKLGVRSRHEAIDIIIDPASGMGTGILSLVP